MDYSKFMKPHAVHPKVKVEIQKEEKKTGVKIIKDEPKPKMKDATNLKGMRQVIIETKPKVKEVLKYFETILEEHDKKRKMEE